MYSCLFWKRRFEFGIRYSNLTKTLLTELVKVKEQGRDENTRGPSFYGSMEEKKDKKTTLHLLHTKLVR